TGTLPPAARILTSFSRLRRILRGCSSVGRAPALQAGGQGFKSPQLHCIYVHRGTTPLVEGGAASQSGGCPRAACPAVSRSGEKLPTVSAPSTTSGWLI